MTVGELVAFNFYVALLVWPLRTIGMTLAWGQRAAAALERVHEVLGTVPEIRDPAQPVALPDTPPLGAVRFRDVTFGYDAATTRAGARCFHARAGGGRIGRARRRDGLGQVDRRPAAPPLLRPPAGRRRDRRCRRARRRGARRAARRRRGVRGHVAVPRHCRRQHRVRRSDRRLANASRPPRASPAPHDFVDELPDGYDTLIGERGYSLSGGQRQRIAIARAIVADPRILVLDDATSAVDPSKEHEIRDAMQTVMHGRTTIVIAHRPGTIAIADTRGAARRRSRRRQGDPRRAARHQPALPRRARLDGPSRLHGDGNGERRRGRVASREATECSAWAPRSATRSASNATRPAPCWARAAQMAAPFRRTVLAALVFIAVSTSATVVGPLLVRYGIDNGIRERRRRRPRPLRRALRRRRDRGLPRRAPAARVRQPCRRGVPPHPSHPGVRPHPARSRWPSSTATSRACSCRG